MKRNYQKPVLDIIRTEQENMIATSSLGIYKNTMSAGNALSNGENDVDVWN